MHTISSAITTSEVISPNTGIFSGNVGLVVNYLMFQYPTSAAIPLVQSLPIQSSVHRHTSGLTHVPPLRQKRLQIAE